eukprot:scaffold138849_cov20-Tisochrysis_lutea.AAC.1
MLGREPYCARGWQTLLLSFIACAYHVPHSPVGGWPRRLPRRHTARSHGGQPLGQQRWQTGQSRGDGGHESGSTEPRLSGRGRKWFCCA